MRLTRDLDTNSMEIHEAAESGDVAAISQAIQVRLRAGAPAPAWTGVHGAGSGE